MKKLYLCLVIYIIAIAVSHAQLPNSGFENWSNIGSYDTPDGWGNLNPNTAVASVYTCTKGTPGNPGNSYLKLTSKSALGTIVPGLAVSGRLNTTTYHAEKGFPCSAQPANLSGNWQYMAYGKDQGLIAVILTKWNSSTHFADTIAYTKYLLPGMVMSWASFNIPITYRNVEAADTGMIILSASGVTPVANSYLALDNLSLSGTVLGISQANEMTGKLSVYPVPCRENIQLEFENREEESLKIQLCDILGNLVYERSLEANTGISSMTIPVNFFSKGIYLIRVYSSKGVALRKIAIE
jgi:hypothetical protein